MESYILDDFDVTKYDNDNSSACNSISKYCYPMLVQKDKYKHVKHSCNMYSLFKITLGRMYGNKLQICVYSRYLYLYIKWHRTNFKKHEEMFYLVAI